MKKKKIKGLYLITNKHIGVRIDYCGFHHLIAFSDNMRIIVCGKKTFVVIDDVINYHINEPCYADGSGGNRDLAQALSTQRDNLIKLFGLQDKGTQCLVDFTPEAYK